MIRFPVTLFSMLALSAPALAADLIGEEVVVEDVDVGFVNSVYFQLLGGVALPGSYTYSFGDEYDLEPGYAVAASVGVVVIDGLSVELDLFHASRTLSVNDDMHIDTTSLMANLKYTAHLNEMFGIYIAGGLGIVAADEVEPGEVDDGSAFGYQVILGASANLTDNFALLAEVRHQNTFAGVELSDSGISIDVPTTAVLVGGKVSF